MMANESHSSVIIDTEMLENYLNTKYYWTSEDSADKIRKASYICKVKNYMGDHNIFNPVVVSIGPYHHEEKTLQAMNQIKCNWMDCILKINRKITLRDYLKLLRDVEHIARSYYTEEITIAGNKFVNMLLLDGFFILVFLSVIKLNKDKHGFMPEEDPNNEIKPLQSSFIMHDLLLIENQIPFFVLNNIYGLFIGEEDSSSSLSEKLCYGVEQLFCQYPISIKETNRPRNFHHLLHLCHMYLRPSRNVDLSFEHLYPSESQRVDGWHRALEYHNAGVKFKKREFNKNSPHSLLDVKLIDNSIEIPYLTVDDNTLSLFMNVVELEKTNPELGNDITAYIIFMSQLAKDAKDVSVLVSHGIIEHDLRCEEEVAALFMRLSEGITIDFKGKFYLKMICHNLEVYYQSRMKSWNVWFRQISSAIHDMFWIRSASCEEMDTK